jgi:hypothetical protein
MRPRIDGLRRIAAAVLAASAACLTLGTGIAGSAQRPTAASTAPSVLVRAGTSTTFYVLSYCTHGSCLAVSRVVEPGGTATTVTPPSVPPPSSSGYGQLTLQFANPRDGVALQSTRRTGGDDRLYLTTDAAASWQASSFGAGRTGVAFAATSTAYVAVTARCATGALWCSDFRLVRSPLDQIAWRTLARLPISGEVASQITVRGDRLWLSTQSRQGSPSLLTSTDDGAHFSRVAAPGLPCVAPASLVATSASTLWATCPTGMMVSFLRSVDAGRSWQWLRLPTTSGTGGAVLDPVAGDVALFAHGLSPNDLFRVSGAAASVGRVSRLPFQVTQALAFVNGRDGLAIGVSTATYLGRLFATVDGGHRWRVISL